MSGRAIFLLISWYGILQMCLSWHLEVQIVNLQQPTISHRSVERYLLDSFGGYFIGFFTWHLLLDSWKHPPSWALSPLDIVFVALITLLHGSSSTPSFVVGRSFGSLGDLPSDNNSFLQLGLKYDPLQMDSCMALLFPFCYSLLV